MKKYIGKNKYQAIVMGSSAGGVAVLECILSSLPKKFPLPLMIVQHLAPNSDDYLAHFLDNSCHLVVKEVEDEEPIQPGYVYLSPPNYHLMVEKKQTLSLSTDNPVNFSRPSIDVLFESASRVYVDNLIGILLTGANKDGSKGLACIHEQGGLTIVQDPNTAESPFMPLAAIEAVKVDYILPEEKIGTLLKDILE
jgi:two-component system, chemotaxis family, protein-glutamate methylesterase/glutaminase